MQRMWSRDFAAFTSLPEEKGEEASLYLTQGPMDLFQRLLGTLQRTVVGDAALPTELGWDPGRLGFCFVLFPRMGCLAIKLDSVLIRLPFFLLPSSGLHLHLHHLPPRR